MVVANHRCEPPGGSLCLVRTDCVYRRCAARSHRFSRAPGCAMIVREAVREAHSWGSVFTISVGCVVDRGEWSLSAVTATGHWVNAWLGASLRAVLRVLTFANRCWIPVDART